ncbi:rRNA maturation RNase YbeY [Alkalihalobacillus sp. LMS39]|uniref:rRNA maturation RNase YbeY n=1 Tax=Alkalihalobacillus sp. LMS39 TaxID=2924032 RepID=UPI001FB1BE0C|nr:rRNA maturation RNase YbeY [Alkalihalobacillus sp. LMS39]UOE95674.1 rRNA maturation RNase YbeY [Alkalihalobacillus sp. LMS39]
MGIEIDINDETEKVESEHFSLIKEVIVATLEHENIEGEIEVSVSLVDNDTIREINKEYRNKDAVTDVISFALNDNEEEEMQIVGGEEVNMLGDIIVSIPRAKEQADQYEHSFERELAFLVVHGTLHLLGYDHMTEQEEKEMFSLQEEILQAYGLKR